MNIVLISGGDGGNGRGVSNCEPLHVHERKWSTAAEVDGIRPTTYDFLANAQFAWQIMFAIEESTPVLVTDAVKAYIGLSTEAEFACDAVEPGAVRRYAQAIMDDDPVYGGTPHPDQARYGGPIAPPLFANHMVRRPLGTPDPFRVLADNPDYDGMMAAAALPPIEPLAHLASLNGGSEFEFFRYPRHGDRVSLKLSYADIQEKESSKGPMVLVIRLYEFRDGDGDLLMRSRMTVIRR